MNIFVLDSNPEVAASMHCDKHVVKMCIELAQLLSTAHHILAPGAAYLPYIYKQTHTNHPCAIWVRKTSANYAWAWQHWRALLAEYKLRFHVQHGSLRLNPELVHIPAALHTEQHSPLTDFAIAMPLQYITPYNAVESYRRYYALGKIHIATWRSGTPDWYMHDITRFAKEKQK